MMYPEVVNELETMRAVVSGKSISRYGDGEFKMLRGAGIKSQQPDQKLSERLREILLDSGDCLVGIPNIRSDTPKAEHWGKFTVYANYLANRQYVSAFITRPDSAPWISTPEYWRLLESLWVGQKVTIVRGSGKSLTAMDMDGADEPTEVIAPRQHAWSEYQSVLERVRRVGNQRVLIGLGPTATVMAADLCREGFHACDLGHVGMFLRKFRRAEPMQLTDVDKYQEIPA